MTKTPIFGSEQNSIDRKADNSAALATGGQRSDRNDMDFLNVREAADFLRVSKSYLDKLRCVGGGPEFVRLGVRKILYRRVDLVGWARARRFDNTSQYDQ